MGKERPKLNTGCPDIDLGDPDATVALYQQFLNSSVDYAALLVTGYQELSARVDLSTIFQDVAANPTVYIDGQWGISHAALTWLALNDPTNPLVSQYLPDYARTAETLLAYWYVREALARCADGVTDWMNPSAWLAEGYVDSFLDFMTPALLVESL